MRDNDIQGLSNIRKGSQGTDNKWTDIIKPNRYSCGRKRAKKDSSNRIKPADHSINFATVLV